MTILLDSTVLIDIMRNRLGRREFLEMLTVRGDTLASCAITVGELYAGMRPSEASITARVLSGLSYFEITPGIARLGGELKSSWAKKGRTLALTDTLIAAVAIENGLSLATDNTKDFPMPDLKLLDLPRPH